MRSFRFSGVACHVPFAYFSSPVSVCFFIDVPA
jgi:hypothetical protein